MNFTPEQAKGLAIFFTTALDNEFALTKKVIAAIPPDRMDFTLGEKGRSIADVAWHIATGEV